MCKLKISKWKCMYPLSNSKVKIAYNLGGPVCTSVISPPVPPKVTTILNSALFFLIILPPLPVPTSNMSLVLYIIELYKVEVYYIYSFVTVSFAKYVFKVSSYWSCYHGSFILSIEWDECTSFHLFILFFTEIWFASGFYIINSRHPSHACLLMHMCKCLSREELLGYRVWECWTF